MEHIIKKLNQMEEESGRRWKKSEKNWKEQKEHNETQKAVWNKIEEEMKIMKREKIELEKKVDTMKEEINNELRKIKEDLEMMKHKRTNEENGNDDETRVLKEMAKELESMKKKVNEVSAQKGSSSEQRTNISREDEKIRNELKWISEHAERESRKKNIIIGGVDPEIMSTKEVVRKWLIMNVGFKEQIKKTWRIKGMEKAIGVQLESLEHKTEILKNKKKVNSREQYITQDLTWTERQNKKKVQEKTIELKQKWINAEMKFNKVITEDETWFWNEKLEKWFRRKRDE